MTFTRRGLFRDGDSHPRVGSMLGAAHFVGTAT